MQKTSLTEAGQTKSAGQNPAELVDSINQVFGLFRINFHNQYYKAFPDADTLNPVKKLWLDGLRQFSPTTIIGSAKSIIESSDYLPTLHSMIKACQRLTDSALPDVHSAYLEACRAPSPKIAYDWSHPAVYETGKRCDWYFLASNSESTAFPIFKNHYQTVLDEIRSGAHLSIPTAIAEESEIRHPKLEKSAAQERINAIRDALGTSE